MTLLLCNIMLALAWAMTIGTFTVQNFFAGFLLGYGALYLGTKTMRLRAGYFERTLRLLGLLSTFVYELIVANIKMAVYTLSPLNRLKPAIVAIPIRNDLSDLEIMTLANMITLTPGTLSLDVSADRSSIFVHFMHVEDPEEAIADIKGAFERRIAELSR
ncbi:MAG: Na+/H+ antiporter subunit E [Planctomycetota bacterium]